MSKMLAAFCAAFLPAALGTALLAPSGVAMMKPKPKIKKVVFTGMPAEPTITVSGRGLGSLPVASAEAPLECFPPETSPGNDYGEAAFFEDLTQTWAAGKAGDCIGLTFGTYTESEVVFHLGSAYREYAPLTKHDMFHLSLNGITKDGKVKFKK